MTTRKIVSKAPKEEEDTAEEVEEVESVKLDKSVDTDDIDSIRLAYHTEVQKVRDEKAELESEEEAKTEDAD